MARPYSKRFSQAAYWANRPSNRGMGSVNNVIVLSRCTQHPTKAPRSHMDCNELSYGASTTGARQAPIRLSPVSRSHARSIVPKAKKLKNAL
jgi:hypothetical protein